MRNQAYKNLLFSPSPPTQKKPSLHRSLAQGGSVCVWVPVCDIDPRHATVIGLREASTQETTGTDSRWHREMERGKEGTGRISFLIFISTHNNMCLTVFPLKPWCELSEAKYPKSKIMADFRDFRFSNFT